MAYAKVAAACDQMLRLRTSEQVGVPRTIEQRVHENWVAQSLWALIFLALVLATGLSGRLERACARLFRVRMLAEPAYQLCFAAIIVGFVVALKGSEADWLIRPIWLWRAYDWSKLWVMLIPGVLGPVLRKSPHHWWAWVSLTIVTSAMVCVLINPEFIAKVHDVTPTGSATLMAFAQPFEHEHEHSGFSSFAAHAQGHRVLLHHWQSLAAFAAVVSLGMFGIHRLGSFVAKRYGERLGFASLGEARAMPLVLLLFVAFSAVGAPVLNVLARHQEREADRFALESGSDGRSCATNAVMHSRSSGLTEVRPNLATIIWRARQPPLATRIEACVELATFSASADSASQ